MPEEKGNETEEHEEGHPFYPTHVLDEIIIFYALLGLLVTLAVLFPFGLHEKADPMTTPVGIKPEWYFLPMYQALKYVPKIVGILGMGLAALVMVIWPFIDALLTPRLGLRFHRILGGVTLVVVLTLGLLGYLSERTATIFGVRYHFDLKGVPHRVEGELVSGEEVE